MIYCILRFLYDYKLECTDALETTGKGFTYRHVTLGHYSWLDHLFLDSSMLQKMAVRHTIKSFESRVSDELYDNLIEKDMLSFWKTWNSKLGSKPIYATQVNGLSSDLA